jgi:hypothetical protein
MNSPKTIQRALLILLAGLTVVCTLPAQINQNTQPRGTPVNGLQMSLSLGPTTVPPSPIPAITLSLRNVGSGQINVLLGASCAGTSEPRRVILNLTDSSRSSQRLEQVGPPEVCASALTLFVVSLQPGAEYSKPLKLEYYETLSNGVIKLVQWQAGGTYSLQAELEDKPQPKVQNAWSGFVTSNKLEIHFPAP